MLFILTKLSLIMVMLSTIIVLSFPSSPLISWIGLELNSLSLIPLIKDKNNLTSHESMMKYFLIQSLTSILFLMPTLISYHFTYNFYLNSTLSLIIMATLLTKLAAAPFHFWLFPLINSISWLSFILLMTWQKIAPLAMLTHLSSNLIVFSIITSTILSPFMMINQNSMKMILGYASVVHMGWLITTNMINSPLVYIYMSLYTINFIPIFYLMYTWNLVYLSQILLIPNKQKFLLLMISLSLSGFPPLMMFMIKIWLTFQFMQNPLFYFVTLILLLSSLMTTYTYIHINFPFLFKNINFPLKSLLLTSFSISLLIFISILFIPIILLLMM